MVRVSSSILKRVFSKPEKRRGNPKGEMKTDDT
jgi:hypothetical protein